MNNLSEGYSKSLCLAPKCMFVSPEKHSQLGSILQSHSLVAPAITTISPFVDTSCMRLCFRSSVSAMYKAPWWLTAIAFAPSSTDRTAVFPRITGSILAMGQWMGRPATTRTCWDSLTWSTRLLSRT